MKTSNIIILAASCLSHTAEAGFFSKEEPTGDPEYYTKDFEAIPAGKTN